VLSSAAPIPDPCWSLHSFIGWQACCGDFVVPVWFTDKEAKSQVSELLSRFELDESAIGAEAIRKSSSDLELLERMLTSLETRRDKALGCVVEYRARY
jgi:hypothetical protein